VAIGLGLAMELSDRMGLCGRNGPAACASTCARSGLPARIADLSRRFEADALIARCAPTRRRATARCASCSAAAAGDCLTVDDDAEAMVRALLIEEGCLP
jgi:3-dehydroquinate synthetase